MTSRRVAVAVLALALFTAVLPSKVSAAVSHDGWGLSIATDEGGYQPLGGPHPLPALGDRFELLRPKVYRLQTIWNAMDWTGENAQKREEWAKGAEKQIERARQKGVQLVILTLRAGYPDTVKAGNYTPNSVTYEYWVRKLVEKFKNQVDVWGPANEPNHGWVPPINGESAKNLPPSLLAEYYQSMKEVVEVWDPSALVTSPDFHDKPDTQTLANYVNNYKNAGGGWGNVVAWHPYYSVKERSLAATNEYVKLFPSYMNIWVTEVGGPFKESFNATKQNQDVSWIINTLGGHPRITRISYYNMWGSNSDWNTALLNSDLSPRPAWYTWCAAAHGNNPNHPDCASPYAGDAVASDVNGDGRSDLVTLSSEKYAYTFPGMSTSQFGGAQASFAGTMDPAQYDGVGHYVIDVADVTGDLRADLVTLGSSGSVFVYPGQGTGGFGNGVSSFAGTMVPGLLSPVGHEPIAVADVTGDKKADFVSFSRPTGQVYVYPGTSAGTFQSGVASFAGTMDSALHDGVGHYFIDVSDVNGDGRDDLVTLGSGGTAFVYPGQANGTFGNSVSSFAGTMNQAFDDGVGHEPIGVDDVDGDGRADLVTFANGHVWVYPAQSSGKFGNSISSFAGTMDSSLFDGIGHELIGLLDVNGDGRSDLVTSHTNGTAFVYRGQANGAFATGVPSFAGTLISNQFERTPGHQYASEKPSFRRRGCKASGCYP